MGFSRQDYWSGLPFPSPGNLPDPGIEPWSPALQTDTLLSEPPGKPTREAHQGSPPGKPTRESAMPVHISPSCWASLLFPHSIPSGHPRTPEFTMPYSSFPPAISRTHGGVDFSALLSQFVSPSLSAPVSTGPFLYSCPAGRLTCHICPDSVWCCSVTKSCPRLFVTPWTATHQTSWILYICINMW